MSEILPIYAVIVAGGQGTRMGNALPKQFLPLNNKPILYYTLEAFIKAVPNIHLILVLPQQHISYAQMVLQAFEERINITIVAGGQTRFHSVKNGLAAIHESSIIMVHDGVRPLVTQDLIKRCIEQATELGSAIPAIPVIDSMRQILGNSAVPIDRAQLRIIQTPQTFKSSILLPAFHVEFDNIFTDEATVVEASGLPIHLIDGEKENIKITTQEDLTVASIILKNRSN